MTPEDTTEQGYEVVYSNAALHWVPDHKTLFPSLMRSLVCPGGVLAVQMPDTRTQPSHTLMIDACKVGWVSCTLYLVLIWCTPCCTLICDCTFPRHIASVCFCRYDAA